MFNLDNLDLDFDDDFSTNIFSKVDSRVRNAVDTVKLNNDIRFSNENTLECEKNESHNKLLEKNDWEVTRIYRNFLDTPLIKESRKSNLKRFCLQDDKPPKKKVFHDGLLDRKFPGPAGLLPDRPFKEISDLSLVIEKTEDEMENKGNKKSVVYSQCSGSVFLTSNYQKLLSDFNLKESENPLNRYTVEWVKKTALSKGLQKRKIPFLGLIIHSVNQGMPDPVLVLRDPTGEIHGSLHREVWADIGGKLRTGIALALRQVGVLITGVIRRQIYLNITMNNILSLYSSSENENQVEVTTVNKMSQLELCKSFEDWLAQSSKNLLKEHTLNLPLFKTMKDINTPPGNHEEIRNLKNKFENLVSEAEEKKVKGADRNSEVLANLGIVLTDSDFNDEQISLPQASSISPMEGLKKTNTISIQEETSSQVLSDAESLIFDEVLSGINFDEFEI